MNKGNIYSNNNSHNTDINILYSSNDINDWQFKVIIPINTQKNSITY